MDTLKVKCQVNNGMFSNKVQATIQTGYGEVETLVSKDFVQNGKLVLKIDHETDDDIYVFIPGDLVKGDRYVKVNKRITEV